MPLFAEPEVSDFYDDRLIISWLIHQPNHCSKLINLVIQIRSNPPLIFDPLQNQKYEIPELNDYDIIVNWVVRKPENKTEVNLKIYNQEIMEEHQLTIRSYSNLKED